MVGVNCGQQCTCRTFFFFFFFFVSQANARIPLPNGAYSAPLDRVEQALDLIREATVSSGFQINVDVAVLIDVKADTLYDEVT